MSNRWLAGCLAGICFSALGQPADDADASWSGNFTGSGYQAIYGFADDPESVFFRAACDSADGLVTLWIHADKALLPGQTPDAGGLRKPIERLPLWLTVDGQRFAYTEAVAQPEEMYGGNEINLALKLDDPLLTALTQGDRARIELEDGLLTELPLNGSAEPFRTLTRHCGNN